MSPRRTWIDSRVDVLLAALGERGWTMPRDKAVAVLGEHLATVADQMRVTEKTARTYITDDAIGTLAAKLSHSLAHESPGQDPGQLQPTHTVPIGLAGKTLAGLGIAATLIVNPDAADLGDWLDIADQLTSLIVLWGMAIAHTDTPATEVRVHAALIHRTIRELRNAVHRLDTGALPRDDGDPEQLRTGLNANIAALDAEL